MKTTIYTSVLLKILILSSIPAFSQFIPLTNGTANATGNAPISPGRNMDLISYDLASGVPCMANSFWAITDTTVDQLRLDSTGVTLIGSTPINRPFDPNLAFCNNLNGGNFSPTFYSTQGYTSPVYFTGTGVASTGYSVAPDYIINCGGNGNYLYYILYNNSFKSIAVVRYNGTAISTVYSLADSISATVADLAVDSSGNVWVFTGRNDGNLITDSLHVVSPAGQMIKQYPFSLNTSSAYGCFLLNSKLYIGLGSDNPAHPNTLIPVNISAGTATAGTPVSMPATVVYSDLASCGNGSPLSVNEHKELMNFDVYPNPVSDRLFVSANTNELLEIFVFDINSREILHQAFSNSVTLKTDQLAKGIYLYKIMNKTGEIKTGKIVKE